MATSEQLRATLKELEAELNSVDSLDDETRAMLAEAMREIEAKLQARQEATPADREDSDDTLAGGLRDAIERFESTHPTLTQILSRLVDTLGQIGI
jgi:uncharacterized protein YukE